MSSLVSGWPFRPRARTWNDSKRFKTVLDQIFAHVRAWKRTATCLGYISNFPLGSHGLPGPRLQIQKFQRATKGSFEGAPDCGWRTGFWISQEANFLMFLLNFSFPCRIRPLLLHFGAGASVSTKQKGDGEAGCWMEEVEGVSSGLMVGWFRILLLEDSDSYSNDIWVFKVIVSYCTILTAFLFGINLVAARQNQNANQITDVRSLIRIPPIPIPNAWSLITDNLWLITYNL